MSIQERLVDLVDWVTQTIRNLRFRSLEVEVKNPTRKTKGDFTFEKAPIFLAPKKTSSSFQEV